MLAKQSRIPQRRSTASILPSALEMTAIAYSWRMRSSASRVPDRIWSQLAEFWVFPTSDARTPLSSAFRSCSREV